MSQLKIHKISEYFHTLRKKGDRCLNLVNTYIKQIFRYSVCNQVGLLTAFLKIDRIGMREQAREAHPAMRTHVHRLYHFSLIDCNLNLLTKRFRGHIFQIISDYFFISCVSGRRATEDNKITLYKYYTQTIKQL